MSLAVHQQRVRELEIEIQLHETCMCGSPVEGHPTNTHPVQTLADTVEDILRVPVEEIDVMYLRRKQINDTDLRRIHWTRNGEVILGVPEDAYVDFDFTGLGNINFPDMYLQPND
jgi:hypothetical protein